MPIAASDLRKLKNAVAKASDGRPGLSEFLATISALHPDLSAAAEGIYCGREGRIAAPIADWGRMLCFNWYTNSGRKNFVEYSYIS